MKSTTNSVSETRQPSLALDARQGLAEIVEGWEAIDQTIYRLAADAVSQVDTVSKGTVISAPRLTEGKEATAALYRRGVKSRSLYLDEFRDTPILVEYVRWLNEQGAAVRTLPTLPKQMMIFDKSVAVLSKYTRSGEASVVIHYDPEVVECLQALFDLNWISASPLGKILSDDDNPILSGERVLLDMLSMGNTYREIGDAMNVNQRTIARRVAELMERLDSKSLFMLGVRAAKRNWL